MKKETFSCKTRIEASAKEVFDWHKRPGAFERLSPPWEKVEVIKRTGGIEEGSVVVIRTYAGPVPQTWVVEHRDYEEGKQFRDVLISGPFSHWEHTHLFEPEGKSSCFIEDKIEYSLPFGALTKLIEKTFVRYKLRRMFEYRHRTTAEDISTHKKYGGSAMKILVTGSTGLVGSSLVPFLTTGGHTVTRLVRSKTDLSENETYWKPSQGEIDIQGLEGYGAVVHLAGENIAGRWTEGKKRKIEQSRVKGTRLLSESLSKLENPPDVLVCASAVGYYGDSGDEILTEESPPGDGFLPDVCQKWEKASQPAAESGIRVVNIRIGLVLSPKGGALEQMLTPFKLGVGGKIGDGSQYWSWISIDDLVGVIYHAINKEKLEGPVNAVSPNPVTNSEFTETLGKVLHRPTMLKIPAFAARLALGAEMTEEMLLASTRVEPNKLLASGYEFRHSDLEEALRHLLGKTEN